jgi:hypothetical protein
MREVTAVDAAGAFAARFVVVGAKEKLSQPERQPLFADSARAMKEKTSWKLAALDTL